MHHPSPRQYAIQRARLELECRPVFLDTETTGLDPEDQIVEICLLDAEGGTLLESLVRPTVRIPPGVIRLHGITDEMVREAPTWAQLWPDVEAALAGRRVAIYNSDFDLQMMKQSHARHRLAWNVDSAPFFCVMRLYAEYYGEWNARYGIYRWHSLENAARQCRIELPRLHRARGDAWLAREVLCHMARQER